MSASRTILVCPHCTLPVIECPCESARADPGCGGYVHANTGAHSCKPSDPRSPYFAENPRTVNK